MSSSKNLLITQKANILALFLLSTIVLAPNNALAFETKLSVSDIATPLATFAADAYTPAPLETPIPDYTYSNSGIAIGTSSPVTVSGDWKTVTKKKPSTTLARAMKPLEGQPIVLEGQASYYSRSGCLGCNPLFIMANGQPLNDNALTMAIGADKRHLVGYQAKVTNLATGLSTTVTITDTGGFYQDKYGNRVADLTIATKEAIGMHGGLGQVRVEVF